MNNHENTLVERPSHSRGEANQEPAIRRKKPYEKPAFLYRAPLEAMASVCTHSPGKASGPCTVAFS